MGVALDPGGVLADAWERRDLDPFLDHIELRQEGDQTVAYLSREATAVLVAELDRRDKAERQARFDLNARALGFRDFPALLRGISRTLDDSPSPAQLTRAAELYWSTVNRG